MPPKLMVHTRDKLRARRDALSFGVGVAAIMAQRSARHTFRRLWDAEVTVFSRTGEDGILDYLCDLQDIARPSCLELGVGDFSECNTRFLAEYRYANVMAVDSVPELTDSVTKMPLCSRTTVLPVQAWITPDNVGNLCASAREAFGQIDVLSVDLDGNDFWVAEAIDVLGVKVIVVEYNPLFGDRLPVSVPRRDDFDRRREHGSCLYYGASLRAFVELFADQGYSLIGTNRVCNNAFFVPAEVVRMADIEIPDIGDLSRHTDWRVRESRDDKGNLTLLTGPARIAAIESMPLVNTSSGARLTVAEAVA